MRFRRAVVVMLFAASTFLFAGTSYVVPTTTVAQLTSNNTSAAGSFAGQPNGNRGAGNISKMDVHSLLYSGATTKVYAHMVMWFGQSNHMSIGYSSSDAGQVQRQISDMVSRGIDGVILDWYGPNNQIDVAAQAIMTEAEKHPGFTFAIMVDQGAIQWFSCAGCSPQQTLVNDLQYMERTYFVSPAYMTMQGQPVVTNFNVDLSYPSVDWNAATAALSVHPVYIFQNNNGFTHTLTDGSYAWVMPTTTDYGIGYLSSFYRTGMDFPAQQVVGATYKGFNDSEASWGSNRIMGQQCGQTWLQTFSEINNLYSSGKQLTGLQLVTWNDYEEATEIESGIENCVSLTPSLTGNSLQWTIGGDESTVDHYTVYISADGENLMPLTDSAPGNRSLNLCAFPIPNASYRLFVAAVGKPSLANHLTGAISYNSTCAVTAAPVPASVAFSAAPDSLILLAGTSGGLTVTAKTQSGTLNTPISLSCTGLPANLTCAFSPASIVPGSGGATSTLTISARAVAAANLPQRNQPFPVLAALWMPFGIGGFVFLGTGARARKAQLLAIVVVASLAIGAVSCGGNTLAARSAAVSASSYSVTIQGMSQASQLSTTVSVVVR